MSKFRGSPSGRALLLTATLLAYGAQTAWAIDPVLGDDSGPGTPADPLRSMAEFNARLSGNVLTATATLTLVGDVVDQQLTLCPLRILAGASLTVNGTATTTATASITTVTGIGPAGTFPWQLTTTGVTWTAADVGKRLVLPTGQVSSVGEFIDASNIIAGAFISAAGSVVTPTASQTLAVQTLSRALPPVLLGTTFAQVAAVTLNGLDMTASFVATGGNPQCSGVTLVYYGCKLTLASGPSIVTVGDSTTFRGCFFSNSTGATPVPAERGTGNFVHQACVFAGGSLSVTDGAIASFSNCLFTNFPLTLVRGATGVGSGANHWRNTASPILVTSRALFTNQNFTLSGSVGNTGSGITVRSSGGFIYTSGGSSKPTLTAATSDTTIGTTARSYAQIPYVDLQANAAPNTLTTLVGTPAYMVVE